MESTPSVFRSVRDLCVGPPRDPFNPETRRHIALIAFFAWVGLGADGLSSAAYGPELGYLALGGHTRFGLYLALATALTVFIISLAYNQVIELFPSGGGGYKVATQLIGPKAGLLSGAALIVDYVLTISISIASATDQLFSLLPLGAQNLKILVGVVLIVMLIVLNLRGLKEAIKVLLPIFIGFVIIHIVLIVYGIVVHADRLPGLIPQTWNDTITLKAETGWFFIVSTLLLAYSQGGGTYTGLEAVSNNVNTLAEPRVQTGKWTMFYMATSLAFTAAGILMLYMLWDVKPVAGETLNAVVFHSILDTWTIGGIPWTTFMLPLAMLLTAGLLFVAANTGFLGGPAVLANMSMDQWVPNQFSSLSSRLVTKNGVILMGVAALGVLIWSHGEVELLAVLYSINVFLTFSLSLFGLCVYWWRERRRENKWMRRFILSGIGFAVTSSILVVLLVEKFSHGAWETVLITGAVVAVCLMIHKHYDETREQLKKVEEIFSGQSYEKLDNPPVMDNDAPTAVFMVSRNRGAGMHTLLWVQRLFPGNFKNFVFLGVGAVDIASYSAEGQIEKLQSGVKDTLEYFVNFCHHHGIAAKFYESYGTDRVDELTKLVDQVTGEFPNAVFFASKLIFVHDNWLTRWLHNQTSLTMQRILHLRGQQMVILPMKIG
ncbi:MAG: APC family permease [Burkholderiales bacterium]